MQNNAILDRADTFFGVCEAIGQDFGFHANWLRVALAVGLLWNPVAMLGIYAALGVAVLASRLLFPVKAEVTVPSPAVEAEPVSGEELKLAA